MSKILLKSALLAIFLLAMGCTKRPSPAQLNTLDAALQSAETAEAELASLESEYAELESELARAKQILAENESEYEVVKNKFGN